MMVKNTRKYNKFYLILFILFMTFLLNAQNIYIKSIKRLQQPTMWQMEGAFAALRDAIPEVKLEAFLLNAQNIYKKIIKRLQQPTKWQMEGAFAALNDAIPEVKLEALKELGKFRSLKSITEDQIKEIRKFLEDKDLSTQAAAIRVLGKCGELEKDYIDRIAEFLSDEYKSHFDLFKEALEAMGNLGKYSKGHINKIVLCLSDKYPRVREAAIHALGNLGKYSKGHINKIVLCLSDENLYVRGAAVHALSNVGKYSKDHIDMIFGFLSHKDPDICFDAGRALRALGNPGEYSIDHIKKIVSLLSQKDFGTRKAIWNFRWVDFSRDRRGAFYHVTMLLHSYLRATAVTVLRKLGKYSRDHMDKIILCLSDKSFKVPEAAVAALGNLGEYSKDHIDKIVMRLSDEDKQLFVRMVAVIALGNLGEYSKDNIDKIVLLLSDKSSKVRMAAVTALGNLGEYSKDHIDKIELLLSDKSSNVRWDAVVALGKLGEYSKDHIDKIVMRLSDEDEQLSVRMVAFTVLGILGKYSKDHIDKIIKFISNENPIISVAALKALGNLGEYSRDHIDKIVLCLSDKNPEVREAAAAALGNIGELELIFIPSILNAGYKDTSLIAESRFNAHYLGGGKEEIEILLKWIGNPGKKQPNSLTHDKAKRILEVFAKVWESTKTFEKIREDLTKQIAEVAIKKNVKWESADLTLLQEHLEHLAGTTHAAALEKEIEALKIWRWVSIILKTLLIHALFWILLIFIYPKSTQVQAIFFWNPYVRKIMGVVYVNLALTLVPFLRKKLFEPFKVSLLADARLDEFDEEGYFKESRVKSKDSKKIIPITKAIPKIKGQIILVGDSGLGKSMFLRHIILHSKRITVYLPAEKCKKGVIEAIQSKVHGSAKDPHYLKNLIYSGAVDIFIDGLNEISANSRSDITQFVENYFKGNVIMTTQPMEWIPPATAKIYTLQPLEIEQIKEFLISRQKVFQKDSSIIIEDYETVCNDYLAKVLDEKQPQELLEATRLILSNPMDLEVVARMLANGQQPNLFSLQEQQYKIMAEDYERVNPGREFPIKSFSEQVYQMRVNDKPQLPKDEYGDEIKSMEKFKLVYSRHSPIDAVEEWYFRHDKIMDFFIVQTFLGDSDLPSKHIDDPRFRGVYFQLAALMPLGEAEILREELIQYAADTKDHSVSDSFIQLLRSRKALRDIEQKQSD